MNHRPIVLLAVAIAAVLAVVSLSTVVDADEQEYDQDLGTMYGYTIQFVFTGSDALTVTWDFGDGSEPVTEWNPQHTYAEKGVYYVTQTAYNTYQGGSYSTAVYKITIAGYPWIDFVSNGGTEVATIQMGSGGQSAVAAERPADPTRNGYEFTGWYTDAALTTLYDWSSRVTEPVTLYAGWSYIGGGETVTVTFDSNGGSAVASQTVGLGDLAVEPADPTLDGYEFAGWYLGDEPWDFSTPVTESITLTAHWAEPGADDGDGFPWWIVCLILTVLFFLVALWTRHWLPCILTIAFGALTVLLYYGVIL